MTDVRTPSILSRLSAAFLAASLGFTVAGCGTVTVRLPPVSGEACIGVPAEVCRQLITSARTERIHGAALVGIRITCEGTCTVANGEATVITTFAGGETFQMSTGWAFASEWTPPTVVDPTPLPIAPTCNGVPADQCLEFAKGILSQPHTQAAITSLDATCVGTCTVTAGRGFTEARFADGTSLREDWVYGSP